MDIREVGFKYLPRARVSFLVFLFFLSEQVFLFSLARRANVILSGVRENSVVFFFFF